MGVIYNQPSEMQPCNNEMGLFIEQKPYSKVRAEIWKEYILWLYKVLEHLKYKFTLPLACLLWSCYFHCLFPRILFQSCDERDAVGARHGGAWYHSGVMPQDFHGHLEDIHALQMLVKTCDYCLIKLEAWAGEVFHENFQKLWKLGQCSEGCFLYLTSLLSMRRPDS